MNGLYLIEPTSVSVGPGSTLQSAASAGSISFINLNEITFSNVFTSRFVNYMIVARYVSVSPTPGGESLRFQLVNNAGIAQTNYGTTRLTVSSNTISAPYSTAATSATMGSTVSTLANGSITYLCGPYLTLMTTYSSFGVQESGASTPVLDDTYGAHTTIASYTGIRIFPSLNRITGRISIYGMAS